MIRPSPTMLLLHWPGPCLSSHHCTIMFVVTGKEDASPSLAGRLL